jgi:protoheme IX farnesyltransferase
MQRNLPTGETAASGLSLATPGDYFALLKPRVMSLVVFTALVGMIVTPLAVPPVIAFAALLAIAVGAGASGALNMVVDADIDRIMARTAGRPIPAGRVTRAEALAFAMPLAVGSVAFLGLVTNWAAAGLLAFTIFFYAVVYSLWLKRSTPQNIVIGGAAGAFPPMIGQAAVTGGFGYEGLALFLLIFTWTPPHFWALALLKTRDYAAAGIPMMPVVAGERTTRRQILAYSLLLAPVGLAPWLMGFGGIAYLAISGIGGLAFVALAWRLNAAPGEALLKRAARDLFLFSILYLFALFATLLAERAAFAALAAFGITA